jgi:hypothetical protein
LLIRSENSGLYYIPQQLTNQMVLIRLYGN